MINMSVKIPKDILKMAIDNMNNFDCEKRQPVFIQREDGKWTYYLACDRCSEGYGSALECGDDCKYRILKDRG